MDINQIRGLMHQLGLKIDDVTEVNEGLTRLLENAFEVDDM